MLGIGILQLALVLLDNLEVAFPLLLCSFQLIFQVDQIVEQEGDLRGLAHLWWKIRKVLRMDNRYALTWLILSSSCGSLKSLEKSTVCLRIRRILKVERIGLSMLS